MGSFSSKIGVLLAAAGSAVGLGSIWKFPYIVGENGGSAFIILYVACSMIFGLPLVMNEFAVGKFSGKSAYGAFRALSGSNRWQWFAWTTILSMTGSVGWLTVMGKNLFDVANDLVTDIMMPLGAMGMALFTGWFVPKARYQGSRMVTLFYLFILRWIVPIALIIIFLDSMNIIKI